MDTRLNLINRSNDAGDSQVVIFAKNAETDFDLAIAWKVIANFSRGDTHPFVYPAGFTVASSDGWGNYTPQLEAARGQQFVVSQTSSGDRLAYNGKSTGPNTIEVLNSLAKGTINASIFKAGKLLALKTNVAPQQKAVFGFKPSIWIGVASQAVEGQVMNSAIMSQVETELSLLGVASADIVMTGGGAGPNAAPFRFVLDNVHRE